MILSASKLDDLLIRYMHYYHIKAYMSKLFDNCIFPEL